MSEEAGIDRKLAELLRQNHWDDFSGWLVDVQDFDEVPLYTRYDQVGFLSHLPYAERNRLLVRTAADYLNGLVEHVENRRRNGHDSDFFCMLSILEWEEWEETGGESLLIPCVWFTNPRKGVLAHVPLTDAGDDPRGRAVGGWLPEAGFLVRRNAREAGEYVRRVYVLRPPMLPGRSG